MGVAHSGNRESKVLCRNSMCMCVQAGDVVILHPEVMHMSAANVSSSIRLSCDTRWQPARDARDARFRLWHTAHGATETADGATAQER